MPGSTNADIFKYSTAIRGSITKEQEQYITDLYKQWSEDVQKQAEWYANHGTPSAPLSSMYYNKLYNQMQQQSKEISNSIYTNIKNGMFKVSDAVVKDAADWMSGFGFSKKGLDAAFSYVPQSTVNALVTGSVYGGPGSWSLSSAIWGDNEKALRDIYSIVAQGVAEQMPIDRIAKKLSQYVSPTKQFQWSGPNGIKIYKHAVDYNAQRLARTLVQHTYQQSFVAATKDNPFVLEYVWLANGPRVCPICADRDGAHFKKNKLPLDHPNGMCTMEPVVDDKMVDKLANWVNNEDGTYPEIDEFAKKFGYDVNKMPKMTLADIKKQYGNSQYKSPSAWYKKLPDNVKKTVDQSHQASGKKWTQWYQDEIMDQSLKKATANKADDALKTAKKAENKAAKTANKTAGKQADVTMQDMTEKYAKLLNVAKKSKNGAYNAIEVMSDNEYDDIAKFMAKNFGFDISTDAKKDKAVLKWIEEALSGTSKTAAETVDKKVVKKAIDNNVSLDNFLSKFKKQTVDKMLSLEEKELGSLTKTQIETLKDYTGSSYESFNAYLRQKAAGEAYTGYLNKDTIDKLEDAVKAFSKIKTKEDYVLRRGTDADDIVYTFLNGDRSMRKKMQDLVYDIEGDLFGPGGKVDEAKLQKHIGKINSLVQGQVGSFGSFTSTSSDWNKGFSTDVEYVIDAPKGTAGTSIMSISKYKTSEGEFLLAPGTKVICEKVEAAKDGHKRALVRVFLKIIV